MRQSTSSTKTAAAMSSVVFLLLSTFATITNALDIEFDKITCDQSLPAYVLEDNVRMTCNNGADKRCTFGNSVLISGTMQYHNLYQYVLGSNSTGYVSADLRLLSVEYSLFNYLPFNFCGDWVHGGQYSNAPCPYDGTYTFNIPYILPWDDGDLTTWFATGWQGYSDLIIYNNSTENDDNQLLASCELHWKTYVTKADESEGWKTLPSAAQAAIILAAIAVSMCLCCTWLMCCRRRRRRKRHVTDADYAPGYVFNDGEPEPKTDFKKMLESSKEREDRQKQEKEEMVHKINLSMKEPDWV